MKTDLQMAIRHCQFQKDRNFRNYLRLKSELEKTLSILSVKEEEELTKKDLLSLVSACCDYMRALNLYNYFKDELTKLLIERSDEVRVFESQKGI